MDFTTFFKKRIEPFIALAVLIMLVILAFQVNHGIKLREEINENCGWEDEDFKCFCEKTKAMEIMDKINNNFTFNVDEEIEYVQIDR